MTNSKYDHTIKQRKRKRDQALNEMAHALKYDSHCRLLTAMLSAWSKNELKKWLQDKIKTYSKKEG